MKKLAIILGVVATVILSACEKNAARILTRGNWEISGYIHGEDETENFAGYVFTFENNGVLQVASPRGYFTGTWTESVDDKFYIDIGGGGMEVLSDDWVVTEKSRRTIRLMDDSDPGEILVFSKR